LAQLSEQKVEKLCEKRQKTKIEGKYVDADMKVLSSFFVLAVFNTHMTETY